MLSDANTVATRRYPMLYEYCTVYYAHGGSEVEQMRADASRC